MHINKSLLSCILAGITSTALAFDEVTIPVNSTCSDSCLQGIQNNTRADSQNTAAIKRFLKNLKYGPEGFGQLKSQDKSTNLNTQIFDNSYWSSTLFVHNLLMPVFGDNQYYPIVTPNSFGLFPQNAPYSNAINGIQKANYKTYLSNYFVASPKNNGFSPISNLDIQPYAFPRSNQIIRNSISSVSPQQFLNTVKTNNSTSDTIQTDLDNQCPSIILGGTCSQPLSQMNVVAGYIKDSNSSLGGDKNYSTKVPNYWKFLAETTAPEVMPSLALDSLLSPLSYQQLVESTDDKKKAASLGLHGQSGMAAADNFIRYLSGDLLPNNISTDNQYSQYQQVANSDSICYQYRLDAAMKVKTYRTMLRNYSAQLSVGTSNLYHLMGKRRADPRSGTSQLEEEFKMATYRIFNPNSTAGKSGESRETPWMKRLNKASGAAIQRQMAILLAEINYQLFLNRKEQERILVTLSAMQLANNAQQKKQLSLNEAASYVSEIQTGSLDLSSSSCTAPATP